MLRKIWPILLLVVLLSACSAAGKSYDAERYDSNVAVQSDGSLVVSETVIFRFTGGPFTYVYRDLPTGRTDGITEIAATLDGRPLPTGTEPNSVEIKRKDPIRITWHLPATTDAVHTFGLTYRALGVVRPQGEQDVLSWGALPVEHDYTIGSSRVTVTWPPSARPAGNATVIGGTGTVEQDGQSAVITAQDLRKDQELTFSLPFARSSMTAATPAWQTREDAASAAALPFALAALALFVLGSAWWIGWGRGARAEADTGFVGPETTPPADRAPAIAGVLAYAGAQPAWQHALGTLFDLGRRGVIDVQEVKASRWSGAQGRYTLRLLADPARLPDSENVRLAPHERGLIEMLFGLKSGELAFEVRLDRVHANLGKRWKFFKDALRDEMRDAGLLDLSREQARSRSLAAAVLLMLLSIAVFIAVAVIFLPEGFWPPILLPAAVFGVSIVGLVVASMYAPLTPSGLAEAARWRAFRNHLKGVARGRETLLAGNLYEALLPLAAALGLSELWAKALARQGMGQPPAWFHALAATGPNADYNAAFVAMVAAHTSAGASSGGAAAGGAAGGGGSGAG